MVSPASALVSASRSPRVADLVAVIPTASITSGARGALRGGARETLGTTLKGQESSKGRERLKGRLRPRKEGSSPVRAGSPAPPAAWAGAAGWRLAPRKATT